MTQTALAYITTGSMEEAREIAQVLVEEKLAACANIIPGVTSFFQWEDEVQEAEEFVVMAKTRADLFDALKDKVVTLHSYDCPCVLALPVEGGHAPFLDWIKAETQG